jgi:hypothetical protein
VGALSVKRHSSGLERSRQQEVKRANEKGDRAQKGDSGMIDPGICRGTEAPTVGNFDTSKNRLAKHEDKDEAQHRDQRADSLSPGVHEKGNAAENLKPWQRNGHDPDEYFRERNLVVEEGGKKGG